MRTAPICPEIIAKPDHLTQHFGRRAGSFCAALAPGDQSSCAYSVAPAYRGCAVGEFKVQGWAIRRAQEFCARARQVGACARIQARHANQVQAPCVVVDKPGGQTS
eukprot:scaffold4424_cov113-Isochrysis_galbana.AAC.7